MKLLSHGGGVFLVQSECFLMGEVFFWYKVKLFSLWGGVLSGVLWCSVPYRLLPLVYKVGCVCVCVRVCWGRRGGGIYNNDLQLDMDLFYFGGKERTYRRQRRHLWKRNGHYV